MTERRLMYCHFCGKSEDDVTVLIAGQYANICNDCVATAVQIILVRKKDKP